MVYCTQPGSDMRANKSHMLQLTVDSNDSDIYLINVQSQNKPFKYRKQQPVIAVIFILVVRQKCYIYGLPQLFLTNQKSIRSVS